MVKDHYCKYLSTICWADHIHFQTQAQAMCRVFTDYSCAVHSSLNANKLCSTHTTIKYQPQLSALQSIDRAWSVEESEYRTTRGLLWRTWFAEWVGAARYLSVRQLIHPRLLVESFSDESGGIHSRLYEELEVQVRRPQEEHFCGFWSTFVALRT